MGPRGTGGAAGPVVLQSRWQACFAGPEIPRRDSGLAPPQGIQPLLVPVYAALRIAFHSGYRGPPVRTAPSHHRRGRKGRGHFLRWAVVAWRRPQDQGLAPVLADGP